MERASSSSRTRARSTSPENGFCSGRDSGGMRRSWLGKIVNVAKRYVIAAAAHNLGRILRKLFGVGKPKALQGEGGLAALAQLVATIAAALRMPCRDPWGLPSRSVRLHRAA